MHVSSSELAAFARRLRSLRIAFARAIDLPDLSAAEFAHMLIIAPATYLALEQGEEEPAMSVLAVLHRRTGVSLDWLIAYEGPDVTSHAPTVMKPPAPAQVVS